jgi:hypothetical protein
VLHSGGPRSEPHVDRKFAAVEPPKGNEFLVVLDIELRELRVTTSFKRLSRTESEREQQGVSGPNRVGQQCSRAHRLGSSHKAAGSTRMYPRMLRTMAFAGLVHEGRRRVPMP